MKIRTILPIVSSLAAFAVPALAQDAPAAQPAEKVQLADEPGKSPEAPKPTEASTAPATAEAKATVDMGGNAAPPPAKRGSLAASPVARGGNESAEASKEVEDRFSRLLPRTVGSASVRARPPIESRGHRAS